MRQVEPPPGANTSAGSTTRGGTAHTTTQPSKNLRREGLHHELDYLAEVASQTGLDPARLPNLTQIASRLSREPDLDPVERLAGPIERAVHRLGGEDAQAATYLWGLGDNRWRLTTQTRRAAAAQLLGVSSWTALRRSGAYEVLRGRLAEELEQLGPSEQRAVRRRFLRHRSVPLIALAALLVAVLSIPTDNSFFGAGYRWLRGSEQRQPNVVARLESLRTGMGRDQLVRVLGEPFSERPVRANPLGVSRRVVFFDPNVYAVVALLNDAETVVYYSVTALKVDLRVTIPLPFNTRPSEPPLLTNAPIKSLGCTDEAFGHFGASWSNFAFMCGGSGADEFVRTIVGWNPYNQTRNPDAGAVQDAVDAVTSGPEAWAEGDLARDRCLQRVDDVWSPSGPEAEAYRQSCELSDLWPQERLERLKASPGWPDAEALATVDTFGVAAPHLADFVELFIAVITGPGPCRAELSGGSRTCSAWY